MEFSGVGPILACNPQESKGRICTDRKPRGFFGITHTIMTTKTKSLSTNPVGKFIREAFDEYGKITWPTKEQAILLTAITIVVSAVVVVLIGLLDLGFNELYQLALDNL